MIEYTVKVDERGARYWFLNGKRHREDGPAVEMSNGTRYWYRNGKYHREDGPAVEWSNGNRFWYLNGERHREDGPAVEMVKGNRYWYLNGVAYSEEEFLKKTAPVKELTVAEIEALLGYPIKVVK